jgi:hypothetical protein
MIGHPKQLIPYLVTLDDEKVYEVKEHKNKRSLDANAYYWVLVNKIASALNQSKDFVHRSMLKQYGETYSLLLPAEYNITGLIKYYEEESTIKKGDKLFKSYKAYLPSSEMDSKQMSVLIDGIVSEAKSMDIETMTPNQIEELKASWSNE